MTEYQIVITRNGAEVASYDSDAEGAFEVLRSLYSATQGIKIPGLKHNPPKKIKMTGGTRRPRVSDAEILPLRELVNRITPEYEGFIPNEIGSLSGNVPSYIAHAIKRTPYYPEYKSKIRRTADGWKVSWVKR